MDRSILMAIVVVFLLILLGLMLVGWRRRQKRQAGFPRPRAVPADTGAELLTVDAFYVATTVSGEPLNRITVAGLGYRARAVVTVAERGMALIIPGQEPIFIPAADVRAVDKATWTIDRVVEQDGMVLVRWVVGESDSNRAEVDSYLRIIDPATASEFFQSAQSLLGHNSSTGGRS